MRDAAVDQTTLHRLDAEACSRALRESTRAAIRRQAKAWGIRDDQAQSLLLDRKAVA